MLTWALALRILLTLMLTLQWTFPTRPMQLAELWDQVEGWRAVFSTLAPVTVTYQFLHPWHTK